MTNSATDRPGHSEASVFERYAAAAQKLEPALCCPVVYSPKYLEVIPSEVIERDYGCGDPTAYVRSGEIVLDLGSGGGKLCFIAAQVVGAQGRVIGVDCNHEMLSLARKHAPTVAERVGYANVDFRFGLIQDLQLDLERLEVALQEAPVADASGFLKLRQIEERLRAQRPLIEDDSVDCVISNCVLNLVRRSDRHQMFAEIFRVLKVGGRAAISDIVSDKSVPEHMANDPTLWSGCLSGAFREDQFLRTFEDAGFHGIRIEKRAAKPWQTIEGIEFRSMTIIAYKGNHAPDDGPQQTVIYRGPFQSVSDDQGQLFHRGQRTAVGTNTYELLRREPYCESFEPLVSASGVPGQEASVLPKLSNTSNPFAVVAPASSCCSPEGACCVDESPMESGKSTDPIPARFRS